MNAQYVIRRVIIYVRSPVVGRAIDDWGVLGSNYAGAASELLQCRLTHFASVFRTVKVVDRFYSGV